MSTISPPRQEGSNVEFSLLDGHDDTGTWYSKSIPDLEVSTLRSYRSKLPSRSSAMLAAAVFGVILHSPNAHASRHRHHHASHSSRAYVTRQAPVLPSRGQTGSGQIAGSIVVGRLGVVTSDTAPITAGREDYGRLLTSVPKGTNLTVTGQEGDYYAVMMVDGSLGFVAKDQVQLLDYQIAADRSSMTQECGPKGQVLIQAAMQYFKVAPYRWGGTTMNGIDCSAFVQAVYSSQSMSIPRTAAEQSNVGYAVPLRDVTQWQVGDRMYFQCHHSYIDHAGMYIGNGYFIHSHAGAGVGVSRVDDPYYWNHLAAVRRSPEMLGDARNAPATAAPDTERSEAQ